MLGYSHCTVRIIEKSASTVILLKFGTSYCLLAQKIVITSNFGKRGIRVAQLRRRGQGQAQTLSAWLRLVTDTSNYSALQLSGINFAILPLINSARQDW